MPRMQLNRRFYFQMKKILESKIFILKHNFFFGFFEANLIWVSNACLSKFFKTAIKRPQNNIEVAVSNSIFNVRISHLPPSFRSHIKWRIIA